MRRRLEAESREESFAGLRVGVDGEEVFHHWWCWRREDVACLSPSDAASCLPL